MFLVQGVKRSYTHFTSITAVYPKSFIMKLRKIVDSGLNLKNEVQVLLLWRINHHLLSNQDAALGRSVILHPVWVKLVQQLQPSTRKNYGNGWEFLPEASVASTPRIPKWHHSVFCFPECDLLKLWECSDLFPLNCNTNSLNLDRLLRCVGFAGVDLVWTQSSEWDTTPF